MAAEAEATAAEVSAQATALDIPVATPDELSAPSMLLVQRAASERCLVPFLAHASMGESCISDSIIAGSSLMAAMVATITTVIRSGMGTFG